MKKLSVVLLSAGVLSLAACSTTNQAPVASVKPVTQDQIPTVPDFEVHAMPRQEVIAATEQCNDAGMKPYVEYVTQKTPYGRVMVAVNVHCNPIRKTEAAPVAATQPNQPVVMKYTVQ